MVAQSGGPWHGFAISLGQRNEGLNRVLTAERIDGRRLRFEQTALASAALEWVRI